jgi:CHAD domain-containing protein
LVRLHRAPEALHQCRIAFRRLRAAMSLFKPLVADPQSEALKDGMRRLAGVLGEARDLDVFKEGLDGVEPALRVTLEDRRVAAYDRVVAMLQSPAPRGCRSTSPPGCRPATGWPPTTLSSRLRSPPSPRRSSPAAAPAC